MVLWPWVWVWVVVASGSGFLMRVVASGVCCGEGGFWSFLFGKREIHREREGKKERGRDEIDNKKRTKNIKK